MKQLVNYIIRQGHTEVAYIYGVNSLVTRNRVDGFLDTKEENGLTVPKEYLRESLYRNSLMARSKHEALQLPNRPTCIIAPDDISAIGVVSAIKKAGLQVVKDISVAGYDGIDCTQFIGIKLTTVRQERDAIGRQAARKLIEMIEENGEVPYDTVFMKQTLLSGNSVKKLN
jgi:DNA-binding LacI/PurR family transcriptional regulator